MTRLRTRAACLVLALLLGASCDQSLRLVVVEQGGGSTSIVVKPEGGSGGGVSVIPTAGTSPTSDGGSVEAGGGSSAGTPDESMGGAAGAPEVPIWDAPPRYTASFVSHQSPGQYIRYIEDKGFIANIDMTSASDKEQASFDMIPGLYDQKCVSFRALGKIGTFFRHAGSRIYMNPANDVPLFLADATFCEEDGMADPAGVTFRSVNYPQRVIHLRNLNELWIDDVPENPIPAMFASECTFYKETAWVERSSP